jgi:hypothetical protein
MLIRRIGAPKSGPICDRPPSIGFAAGTLAAISMAMLMIAHFVKHPERGWTFNRGISVRLRPYRACEDLAQLAQPHDRARDDGADEPVARAEGYGRERFLEEGNVDDGDVQQQRENDRAP